MHLLSLFVSSPWSPDELPISNFSGIHTPTTTSTPLPPVKCKYILHGYDDNTQDALSSQVALGALPTIWNFCIANLLAMTYLHSSVDFILHYTGTQSFSAPHDNLNLEAIVALTLIINRFLLILSDGKTCPKFLIHQPPPYPLFAFNYP